MYVGYVFLYVRVLCMYVTLGVKVLYVCMLCMYVCYDICVRMYGMCTFCAYVCLFMNFVYGMCVGVLCYAMYACMYDIA